MAAYLLDTNILIRRLRDDPVAEVLMERLSQEGSMACSALSVYEVALGMPPREEAVTMELLGWLNILPVTRQIAETAGRENRIAQARGRRLPAIDALIGATALVHGLTVVTADPRGFQIPGLDVIAV